MAKTSVIIPARNELYLVPTAEDVFTKAVGEVEVVAILEGYEPEGWKDLVAKYPNLHTIKHNEPKGMRPSINEGVASAIHRGAKYLLKLDAHCMVDEGWDEKLRADCEPNWVVVPRRKRLDPENWKLRDDGRPDIDYHYLSFPDNVKDFGGPGLNGKVWPERARERFGKPEYDIDEEMSSQGSGWFMHADYFKQLELMDHISYGTFWNEFQEIGLKCWLSGGQVMVNKKTWYAHWHKGSAGRGYRLDKELLNQGATYTKKWLFNEAWAKQALPFKTLIERFWPVPGWPENWEELVYGPGKSTMVIGTFRGGNVAIGFNDSATEGAGVSALKIHSARYGISDVEYIDVKAALEKQIVRNSLDIAVTNAALGVGNPFRGIKKKLIVTYSYDGNEPVTVTRDERDWLIIGQSARYVKGVTSDSGVTVEPADGGKIWLEPATGQVEQEYKEILVTSKAGEVTMEATMHSSDSFQDAQDAVIALNDCLIRKFNIPDRRRRGPMPIELRDFHRNDLAALFAELNFTKGVEVGVAEGNYSEVLLKANPKLHLLLVDPWTRYSDNPRAHSKEHQEFSLNETKRKTKGYDVEIIQDYSMNAVRNVPLNSLDFCYIDGHHSFDYVMQDLIEWSKRVKSGGIVSGDDLYAMKWGGVVEAVYAYTNAHNINPWFMINAHKSVDFFWVKP